MIKLYSIGCPQCGILEAKLEAKNIKTEKISDQDTIIALGMRSVPILELEDGTRLVFKDAVDWVNALEV